MQARHSWDVRETNTDRHAYEQYRQENGALSQKPSPRKSGETIPAQEI